MNPDPFVALQQRCMALQPALPSAVAVAVCEALLLQEQGLAVADAVRSIGCRCDIHFFGVTIMFLVSLNCLLCVANPA